jgi:hypothetical protein
MKLNYYKYLFHSLLQILFYIVFYEVIISLNIIDFNLALGITSKYVFHLFVFLSIIVSVIYILLKKYNFSIVYVLLLLFILVSSIEILSSKKVLFFCWLIATISSFLAYVITKYFIKN